MQSILAAIVRHILTIYGGATIAGGNESIGEALRVFVESLASGDPNAIAGAALTVGAVAWSIYEKSKRKQKDKRYYHDGDGIIREAKQ